MRRVPLADLTDQPRRVSLAVQVERDEHGHPRPPGARERAQGVVCVAGGGKHLEIGLLVDKELQPCPHDRKRFDDDDTPSAPLFARCPTHVVTHPVVPLDTGVLAHGPCQYRRSMPPTLRSTIPTRSDRARTRARSLAVAFEPRACDRGSTDGHPPSAARCPIACRSDER